MTYRWAAAGGHDETVCALLDHEAHLDEKCTGLGRTALAWAAIEVSFLGCGGLLSAWEAGTCRGGVGTVRKEGRCQYHD